MDFKCFRCSKTYLTIEETFKHLKKDHFLCDNGSPIKCIRNNTECQKSYQTFRSLRSHLKICDANSNQTNEKVSYFWLKLIIPKLKLNFRTGIK